MVNYYSCIMLHLVTIVEYETTTPLAVLLFDSTRMLAQWHGLGHGALGQRSCKRRGRGIGGRKGLHREHLPSARVLSLALPGPFHLFRLRPQSLKSKVIEFLQIQVTSHHFNAFPMATANQGRHKRTEMLQPRRETNPGQC